MAEAKHQSNTLSRRKMALVIGIDDYKYSKPLKNAVNDANAMAYTLQSIGFTVTKEINPTYDKMKTALFNFEQSIKQDSMVLFYFAGHGIQWEDQNFLIPKENANKEDANIQQAVLSSKEMTIQIKDNPDVSLEKLKRHMIHVQRLLEDFTDRLPFATICLLDCCRVYFRRSPNLDKMTARAFSTDDSKLCDQRPIGNVGTLIGFACAAGTIAYDNGQQANGLFTKHLLEHIVKPNRDIFKILGAVTRAVKEESALRQIPYHTGSLSTEDDICLCETAPGT
ncbi:unnamed protein product [Rotaria sp. Silwood2]|nr:unnamed protein product [Rotaria sp. Silwood2]CAF4161537.1 unnamed protein product [Rotaria sp. Silwood2]CAF4297594.1 unnamed protein product [Rotaria sp. Silwood2]CAF4449146.1 unnamed protein product [Rotaria sp. Silwood2]